MKKVLKRFLAFALAISFQLVSISAYASGVFNPLYSGTLRATDEIYMFITEDDAVMNRILYPVSSTSNAFLSISNPSSFYFSKDRFAATYSHHGAYYDAYGNFMGFSPETVLIQTSEVHPTYSLGFILTGVYVEYNTIRYYST